MLQINSNEMVCEVSEKLGVNSKSIFEEPGHLDELERRVEEAERKFQAADLDLRLKELEAARQRQVKK